MKKIRAAIVGCGQFGIGSSKLNFNNPNHFKVIKNINKIEIISLCDLNHKNLKNKIFNKYTKYKKIKDLLKKEALDMVIIVTSNESHFKMIKECQKYNISYIICEKPIVNKFSDLKKIINSDCNNIITNFSRRYLNEYLFLKRNYIQYLKKVSSFTITFNRGLINNGSHYFDLIEWFFGNSCKIKSAILYKSKFLKNDFYGNISIETKDKILINLAILDEKNVSYENIKFIGSGGIIEIQNNYLMKFYNFHNEYKKYIFAQPKLKWMKKINSSGALEKFYNKLIQNKVQTYKLKKNLFYYILKRIEDNHKYEI